MGACIFMCKSYHNVALVTNWLSMCFEASKYNGDMNTHVMSALVPDHSVYFPVHSLVTYLSVIYLYCLALQSQH